MKSTIPWALALIGLGYATWAIGTNGGHVSWKLGCAPTFLGGAGWTQGQINIAGA